MTAGRRFALAISGPMLAVLIAGCPGGGSDPTPTATTIPAATAEATRTPEAPPINILPTATPTPAPLTATPIPPAAPTGLWVFDLARARRTVLYEGDATVEAQLDASGNAVTTSVATPDGVTAIRFDLNGDMIEEHPNRGLIASSDNGESRIYLDLEDPETPRLVLERQGAEVGIEGTRPRVGLSFSPSGERLLTLSERAGSVPGEVVRTFSVHSTADGRLRMQFEHRALVGSLTTAYWSPSSRYIADESIAGLAVRDTVTGKAWLLGPGGSARWSPTADQLLVITDLGRLSVVDVPELTGVDLGTAEAGTSVQFDRDGRLAVVTVAGVDGAGAHTTAFDVNSGDEVASWPGLDASRATIGGTHPVISVGGGIGALFAGPGCEDGFIAYHPALGDRGRCLSGANPRWSPNGQFLVYARDREVVLLGVAEDEERVIAGGTPPASVDGGPLLRWSSDGSWVLIQWPLDRSSAGHPAE